MEDPTSLDDSIGKASSEPDGVKPLATNDSALQERSDTGIKRQVSKSISLEPPPAIKRPPKIKDDSISLGSLLFFWGRTEHKDVPSCTRCSEKSYVLETTFRFLGFNMTTSVIFKIADGELETAVETIRLGWFSFQITWVHDYIPRARARFEKMGLLHPKSVNAKCPVAPAQDDSSTTDVERQNDSTKEASSATPSWLYEHYYVVVGFMSGQNVPKETLRRVTDIDGLFQQIRKAHRHLRNPFRRFMSMKEISGFGIYECDPIKGYHKEVELDRETERALAELWRAFCGHKLDYEGRWLMWIHQHFNNGSKNPELGRLSLEFKLRWSVFKVVFYGLLPVLLSLTIGFWYMYSDHGEVTDQVAIAEAAWVIATYITTTSALLLALLAIITQFGDI